MEVIMNKLKNAVASLPRKAMQIIYSYFRQYKKPGRAIGTFIITMLTLYAFSAGLVLGMYTGRALPNTVIAEQKVGGLTPLQTQQKISDRLQSINITLSLDETAGTYSASELGIGVDEQSIKNILASRSPLQVLNPWLVPNRYEAPLNINNEILESLDLTPFENEDFAPSQNAEIAIKDNELIIKEESIGYGLDKTAIVDDVKTTLQTHLRDMSRTLAISPVDPLITKTGLDKIKPEIIERLSHSYKFTDGTTTVQASKKDIIKWLNITYDNNSEQLLVTAKENAVISYIETMKETFEQAPSEEITTTFTSGRSPEVTTKGVDGKIVTNTKELADQLIRSVNNSNSFNGTIETKTIAFSSLNQEVDDAIHTRTVTYEVITWGNIRGNLADFKQISANIYADSRGWSAAGVRFQRVESGGNFSLVLAEPARVESAAPICSALYSCRVGRYVIINDHRWRGATPAWNQAGGSLLDYRRMVVNHETGHWFGLGHLNCPGAGQPAPVMQQQSINLQGCSFNPWPTSREIAMIR